MLQRGKVLAPAGKRRSGGMHLRLLLLLLLLVLPW
jgi:hypothetical protein